MGNCEKLKWHRIWLQRLGLQAMAALFGCFKTLDLQYQGFNTLKFVVEWFRASDEAHFFLGIMLCNLCLQT